MVAKHVRKPMRVLCVCLGNICRSPSAEAVLRRIAPDWSVDSAGTSDWHIGAPPYGQAIRAGAERGYAMEHLRARQVVAGDFKRFDLILAMDGSNLRDIEALRPPGNDTPVKLILDFADGHEGGDVPDPYYTRDFDGALDLIEKAAEGLLASMARR
jgi:protein-tyrosine phosphatase